MRYPIAIVFAVTLSATSLGAQDVCAGATSPKAASRRMDAPAAGPLAGRGGAGAAVGGGALGVARGVNMYPGSGAGPIPDVTDWKPRGKIPVGTELIIQGRGLVPGQFNAMLAGSLLTPTSQTSSEIRFRVPDVSAASPLVVYTTNGQPRTLETAYFSYDPTPYITRVVPTVFGVGDPVTVCGTSLFDVIFADMYSPAPVPFAVQMNQVRLQPGNFIELGTTFLSVDNPVVSPTGDRITFRAGSALKRAFGCIASPCNTPQTMSWFAAPFDTIPPTVTGVMGIRLTGVSRTLIGPSLTWKAAAQAPPRISAVYGKYFGSRDPFVILPTPNMQSNALAQAYVEGQALNNVSWKIGATPVSGGASGGGLPADGSRAILTVPLNASSGVVCASSTIATGCAPAPLPIFGGPVISRMPTMPLALRTSYTIEGLNLLPPANIAGLKYEWKAGMGALDATAVNSSCNMVLQVLEHTPNRIVFRVGDPARTTPVPASCASSNLFQPSPNWTMNLSATLAGQPGVQSLLKQVPFFLKP